MAIYRPMQLGLVGLGGMGANWAVGGSIRVMALLRGLRHLRRRRVRVLAAEGAHRRAFLLQPSRGTKAEEAARGVPVDAAGRGGRTRCSQIQLRRDWCCQATRLIDAGKQSLPPSRPVSPRAEAVR